MGEIMSEQATRKRISKLAELAEHMASEIERLRTLLDAADTAISALIGQGRFGRTHIEDARAHGAVVAYQALK